jgi:hypothetical protein
MRGRYCELVSQDLIESSANQDLHIEQVVLSLRLTINSRPLLFFSLHDHIELLPNLFQSSLPDHKSFSTYLEKDFVEYVLHVSDGFKPALLLDYLDLVLGQHQVRRC